MPEPVIEWIPGMWALTGKLLRLSLQSGDYKKTALGTGQGPGVVLWPGVRSPTA